MLALLKHSVEGAVASFGEIGGMQRTVFPWLECLPCVQARSSRRLWWLCVKVPDIMLVRVLIYVAV
jgi:hypothetical protein